MGIRDWMWRLLDRGEAPEVDPGALVELAVVRLPEGPMLLAQLEAAGIDAQGIEAFDVVSEVRNHMRILVRRCDLAAANEIVMGAS